jgi:signal transduction histidine kinase
LAGEQVIGACLLEHRCPGFFTEELIHWATALSGQVGVAIQNAWLFEQVRDGREHLQALSRRLVEVQENERHYIARELHDEAGQALASLKIGLRHLERDSHDPATVIERCNALKMITDEVLEDLHRLAIDLRPAALDHLGLVAALRQQSERFSDETRLTVQFEVVGKVERLPNEMETAIYRIVQEALTNVVRHARATRVDILLERREDLLVVVVEDNGVGFDPERQDASRLGVLGMRERADMLGGRIIYESAPGKGATMLLEVPCQFES